ncbi:MAG: hypothetical protein HDS28_05310 [Bacteroides sp.]|nr:hypothetical protein [Bacteroides sp.]
MDRKLTKKEKRNITLKVWYKAGGIILGIAIAVGVLLAFVGEKTDEKSLSISQAERGAYEKVIRILSHEVNNTMCGVRSVFGLLSDSIHEKDLKEAIGSCDRRCEQLCEFVTSYADVIRLPQPNLKKIDLVNEVNRVLPFLRMMMPEDVKLLTDLQQKKMIISADNIQLQQVIINVVKNAVESIKGEGYVLIRISEEKKSYVLEIVNNGEPIPEEVAKNMFRPFFTNKPNGRGIGLTLTSEILTRHKTNFRYSPARMDSHDSKSTFIFEDISLLL